MKAYSRWTEGISKNKEFLRNLRNGSTGKKWQMQFPPLKAWKLSYWKGLSLLIRWQGIVTSWRKKVVTVTKWRERRNDKCSIVCPKLLQDIRQVMFGTTKNKKILLLEHFLNCYIHIGGWAFVTIEPMLCSYQKQHIFPNFPLISNHSSADLRTFIPASKMIQRITWLKNVSLKLYVLQTFQFHSQWFSTNFYYCLWLTNW